MQRNQFLEELYDELPKSNAGRGRWLRYEKAKHI